MALGRFAKARRLLSLQTSSLREKCADHTAWPYRFASSHGRSGGVSANPVGYLERILLYPEFSDKASVRSATRNRWPRSRQMLSAKFSVSAQTLDLLSSPIAGPFGTARTGKGVRPIHDHHDCTRCAEY